MATSEPSSAAFRYLSSLCNIGLDPDGAERMDDDWVNRLSQHQGAQWACSMTELLGKLACGDSILVSDVWIAALTG